MCSKAMRINLAVFFLIPDQFKTYGMCIKALEVDPWQLKYVTDQYIMQEICDNAVRDDSFSLQFVADWFVTQQQVKLWHNDDDYCNDNEMIKWYHGYQKRKTQKVLIKEELIPIAWHSSRWCMAEDEKRDTEKLWK